MKTNLFRVAVLAVVAAFTMVGSTFAGQAQMSKATPDPADWQYREAMETGNLPSPPVVIKSGSGTAADVSTVEYGGKAYRIGIDTP